VDFELCNLADVFNVQNGNITDYLKLKKKVKKHNRNPLNCIGYEIANPQYI